MQYKELRKVIHDNTEIELFIIKQGKGSLTPAWCKIYKAKNTRKFDNYVVGFVGAQYAECEPARMMLVADLYETKELIHKGANNED